MYFKLFTFFVCFCLAPVSYGQYDVFNAPLVRNGDTLYNAWAGGLNAPIFSTGDLNQDNLPDLLVFDRSARITVPFINTGKAGKQRYKYNPLYRAAFPSSIEEFAVLRDYNGDAVPDLFYQTYSNSTGTIYQVRKGYYAQQRLQFHGHPITLNYAQNQKIEINTNDIPVIDDIDGDGDLDLLAFGTGDFTSNIIWYRNLSVENGHGLDSLQFEIAHSCWGMATENSLGNNTMLLSNSLDTCPNNPNWSRNPRHVNSTLATVDVNGDAVVDILMGDKAIGYVNMMQSQLKNDSFMLVAQDTFFATGKNKLMPFDMPGCYFLDLDQDNRQDMLCAAASFDFSAHPSANHVWHFEDSSSSSSLEMKLRDTAFLVDGMLDMGEGSIPCFSDINNDGLIDLLVGHRYRLNPDGQQYARLALLTNIGTATAPVFEWTDDDFLNLSSLKLQNLHPTTGDLNNDGKVDLLLGELQGGTLVYIEQLNSGWATPVLNYKNIDAGRYSTPQLIDLDKDGKLDIVSGNRNGNLFFYRNTGTTQSPVFNSSPTASLGNIASSDLAVGSKESSVHFFEIAGHFEIFWGHSKGGLGHIGPIENALTDSYSIYDASVQGLSTGLYSTVSVADLNADGRLELITGNLRGGLELYSVDTVTVNVRKLQKQVYSPDFRIYPNPNNGLFQIDFGQVLKEATVLSIYSLTGQLVLQEPIVVGTSMQTVPLPTTLANGYYFVRIGKQGQLVELIR